MIQHVPLPGSAIIYELFFSPTSAHSACDYVQCKFMTDNDHDNAQAADVLKDYHV